MTQQGLPGVSVEMREVWVPIVALDEHGRWASRITGRAYDRPEDAYIHTLLRMIHRASMVEGSRLSSVSHWTARRLAERLASKLMRVDHKRAARRYLDG